MWIADDGDIRGIYEKQLVILRFIVITTEEYKVIESVNK